MELSGELPHRQLRKLQSDGDWSQDSELPHRQLRNGSAPAGLSGCRELPHRQLRIIYNGMRVGKWWPVAQSEKELCYEKEMDIGHFAGGVCVECSGLC